MTKKIKDSIETHYISKEIISRVDGDNYLHIYAEKIIFPYPLPVNCLATHVGKIFIGCHHTVQVIGSGARG